MSNDNVQQNPPSPVALSIDEAAEAILNNWRDAEKSSQEGNLEATEDSSETNDDSVNEDTKNDVSDDTNEDPKQESQENETEQESETEDQDEISDETDDESEEEENEILLDDAIVEVTVDGNVEQVSVKSLKRLHGQESSLTKKSQEVSQSRKEADEALKQADFVMQSMLTRAEERYKPYSEVDMLLASKTMEADDFALLRNEANQAQSDLKYLKEESQKLYTEAQDKMVAQQQENAKKAIEVLKQDIPEWSTQLYDQIREFSITSGLPEQEVNQYSDPTVIKLLHKAMLYDKSKKTANVKKVKAKKTKVLRSKKAPPSPTQTKDVRKQAAYDKLRTQGGNDLDDISAAILAGWES